MCCAELERNSHSWATVSSGNIVHEGARSGLHRRHHAGMYSGRPGIVVILYPQEVYFLLAIYVLGSVTILQGVAIASLVCSTFYDCCCCCDRMFKTMHVDTWRARAWRRVGVPSRTGWHRKPAAAASAAPHRIVQGEVSATDTDRTRQFNCENH